MDAKPRPAEEFPAGPATIGLLLRRAHRRAARAFSEQLQPYGLDNSHAGVLIQLARPEPLTQRDLIALLSSDRSSMVRIIDELEARGLAVRTPHPTDRRAHAIRPTEAGRVLATAVQAAADAVGERMLACLEPAQRTQLKALLQQFVDAEH